MTQAASALLNTTDFVNQFCAIRARTVRLCEPLRDDDMNLQAAAFASPPKWHLGHVTWFFETFLLVPYLYGYRRVDEAYPLVFNSYYVGAGPFHARGKRNLLSRPTLAEVKAYRQRVNEAMVDLLTRRGHEPEIAEIVWIGLQHEEQHQELLLTDLKYALSFNPLLPAYRTAPMREPALPHTRASNWFELSEGVHAIGAEKDAAAYDHEKPRHRVFLEPVHFGSQLVTNRDYLDFMADDGYARSGLWLSEGWDWIKNNAVRAPLYWLEEDETEWREYTLEGLRPLRLDAPVTHVSYFEADAYARWAKARLPREEEWEVAAAREPVEGNFLESDLLHPEPAVRGSRQFFGDTWEWTLSSYSPYPGYRPYEGILGEYNGKFMCGQFVLRGGSCTSPRAHLRPTYRNFFPPDSRWQFTGIRLAKDMT